MRDSVATAALVLAGLLGAAGAAHADGAKADLPAISVQGEATREVAPDMAVVSVGVSTDRPTAADASSQNSRAAAAVIAEIKASGVAERDISTQQVSLTPVYETDKTGATNPRVKGFHAANVLEIRMRDLGAVGALVGRLVDNGANTLQGIDFMVSKPGPVLDELRGDATRDARRKAQIYAEAAGVKLGRILEIAPENQPPVMPMRFAAKARMTSDAVPAPALPVQAGVESLEARVSVTWELVQ